MRKLYLLKLTLHTSYLAMLLGGQLAMATENKTQKEEILQEEAKLLENMNERPLPKIAHQSPDMSQFDWLPPNNRPKINRLRVLILGGEGTKAFAPIKVLEEIEHCYNKSAQELFHIIAGLNMGSFFASMYAKGDSTHDVIQSIYQEGEKLFPQNQGKLKKMMHISKHGSDTKKYAAFLQEIFKDKKISELKNNLIVAAQPKSSTDNITFSTYRAQMNSENDYPLHEIIRAATAKRTLYSSQELEIKGVKTRFSHEDAIPGLASILGDIQDLYGTKTDILLLHIHPSHTDAELTYDGFINNFGKLMAHNEFVEYHQIAIPLRPNMKYTDNYNLEEVEHIKFSAEDWVRKHYSTTITNLFPEIRMPHEFLQEDMGKITRQLRKYSISEGDPPVFTKFSPRSRRHASEEKPRNNTIAIPAWLEETKLHDSFSFSDPYLLRSKMKIDKTEEEDTEAK